MVSIGGSVRKRQSGLVAQAARVVVDTRRAVTCVSTTLEHKSNDRANELKATKISSVELMDMLFWSGGKALFCFSD